MKRSNAYVCSLILAGTSIFASCQKDNVLPSEEQGDIQSASKKAGSCSAAGFNITFGSGNQMVFSTENTSDNGKTTRIQAGVYQGGGVSSIIALDVKQTGKTINIYRAGSATDIVLAVTLNNNKRPVSVSAGNTPDHNFLPTDFEYSNGRLNTMKILLAGNYKTSNFKYSNGNITSIEDVASAGEIPGRVEYEYNLNATAAQQLYLEETRKFSWNTFTLLQYLGYFPELDPNHLRTRTRVFWENNYKAFDANLVNHQVENDRLIRYDVTFTGSNISIPHYINWQCSSKNTD